MQWHIHDDLKIMVAREEVVSKKLKNKNEAYLQIYADE